jgi:dGTPase
MLWTDLIGVRTDGERKTRGRSEFERDQDRIIFSSPFRRLNDKTQVLPIPQHYFVHNRLTHSIETACVGRSLGNIAGERGIAPLDPDWDASDTKALGGLIQAACLAHDIGNPPFGHSGEDAISSFFERNAAILDGLTEAESRDFTAFEGNAQGLRIIASIAPGLKLTENTIAAFTKYPRESVVRGGYARPEDAGRRDQKKYGAFQSERKILEDALALFGSRRLSETGTAFARYPFAFLVEAADDICYLIIDLEDAVRLGIIGLHEVEAELETIIAANPEEGGRGIEAERASSGGETDRMAYFRAKAINSLIFQCAEVFSRHAKEIAQGSYASSLTEEIPSSDALKAIWDVSREKLYRYKPVLEIEAAGFEIVSGLLEQLVEAALVRKDKRNRQFLELFPDLAIGDRAIGDRAAGREPGKYETLRLITDYVSGMTDSYAVSTFRRIRGMELPTIY